MNNAVYILSIEEVRDTGNKFVLSHAFKSLKSAKAYAKRFQGGFPKGIRWTTPNYTNVWWCNTGLYEYTISYELIFD